MKKKKLNAKRIYAPFLSLAILASDLGKVFQGGVCEVSPDQGYIFPGQQNPGIRSFKVSTEPGADQMISELRTGGIPRFAQKKCKYSTILPEQKQGVFKAGKLQKNIYVCFFVRRMMRMMRI
jgi:hypothetical protein